jgi:hypothetical protein
VRTYLCQRCDGSIIVGHPRALLRQQALDLAHEAYSLFERLLHRQKILRKLLTALEEQFYREGQRYRTLPSSCPKCGFRQQGMQPWWKPGLRD